MGPGLEGGPALLEEFLSALDLGKPFPQPNLFLLRQRADEVLAAAEALTRADGVVDPEERDFVKMVAQLLGKP